MNSLRHQVVFASGVLLILGCLNSALAQEVLGEPADPTALSRFAPSGDARAAVPGLIGPEYKVQIVYLVPSNRDPQPDAEKTLQRFGLNIQLLYRENMARQGYGNRTFEFETEEDGVIPRIRIVRVAQPDTAFHDLDYVGVWGRVLNGLASAGAPAFFQREVLWVVAEIHRQLPDGTLQQGTTFFGGTGIVDTGVAVITGETLARMPSTFLVDDRPYGGLVIPAIGPIPLVGNVSFPGFEGSTVSSTSSSAQGGAAHELGHAFALPHDFTNDQNFNGNLMGNGLRGVRGFFHPERYSSEEVGLSAASAMHLNNNRFFNAGVRFTDSRGPVVATGNATTIAGLFQISFNAVDADSSLAGAILRRNGNAVAHMPLTGNSVQTSISTPDYQPGVRDQWELVVYDAQANRTVASVALTPPPGSTRAPVPFIRLSKRNLVVGEAITLDASGSSDPDGPASQISVQWDLNNDGVFDTPPSIQKALSTSFSAPGVYQISARLQDAQGNVSVSAPLGVRVEPPVINDLITFEPLTGTSTFTPDASGCPSGYAGKFLISARLTNRNQQTLSNLRIGIAGLSAGNLLVVEKVLLQERQIFDVPGESGGALQLLSGEAVDVPFAICLEERRPFEFLVNVHATAS